MYRLVIVCLSLFALLVSNVAAQDIAVLSVYNQDGFENQGAWTLITGSSYTYFADVTNLDMDIEEGEYVLNFLIIDPDGEELFDYDMSGPAMDAGDTIIVECDSAWTVPEDAALGRYDVWVTAVLEDDEDEDNDRAGLDQIVFDITEEDEEVPEEWFGYISNDEDNLVPHSEICDCGENVGVILYHPGGDQLRIELTNVRVAVHSDNHVRNIVVRVGMMNREVNQFAWIREFEAETAREEGWEWLEIAVPRADLDPDLIPATMHRDEALIVLLEHSDNVSIMVDNSPPVAGTISHLMPFTMCYSSGNDLWVAEEGDFAIQAQLHEFIIPRRGVFRVEPNPMEFGYDLDRDTDHTMNLTLTNQLGYTVTVRNVLLPREEEEFLSVNLEGENIRERFDIPTDSSVVIEVTYHAPEYDHVLESPIRFVTNADVDPQFNVWVNAGTAHPDRVVDRILPAPGQFALLPPHPSPFNSSTDITYHLPIESHLDLGLYDISGRQVMTLFSGVRQAGQWNVVVDGSQLASGIYFVWMSAEGQSLSQKVVLIK